ASLIASRDDVSPRHGRNGHQHDVITIQATRISPSGLDPLESQIDRLPALAQGLPLVAGLRPISGPHAPVRRPFGEPSEVTTPADGSKRMCCVIAAVARKSKLAAGRQYASEVLYGLRRDEPALEVPLFRPRIRKQNNEPRNSALGKPAKHLARVAVMDPNRLDPTRLDRTEQARHPVDERLAADESDIYVVPCLKKEMLARAESYFEPNLSD